MDYNFSEDLKSIRMILGMTQQELADAVGIEQATVSRNENRENEPSRRIVEQINGYAFDRNVRINRLKEMFWRDTLSGNHKLLFHGAKAAIDGEISIDRSRPNNDFGKAFYTGESYKQAISFVSNFDNSSVYMLDFDDTGLDCKLYEVGQEWMMAIAYYRGTLSAYESHPMVQEIVRKTRECDYIVAPIADNRMFQIINSFISGEITDMQCEHSLAATNLGKQYIFVSEKAIRNLSIVDRCYISRKEKEHYKKLRIEDARLGEDKVKLARIKFRGQGKYIDEILG